MCATATSIRDKTPRSVDKRDHPDGVTCVRTLCNVEAMLGRIEFVPNKHRSVPASVAEGCGVRRAAKRLSEQMTENI